MSFIIEWNSVFGNAESNKFFFEWIFRNSLNVIYEQLIFDRLDFVERMNNLKQVEEQNESLWSDVFCEGVQLILVNIKIITFEYMIEISLNFFQKLQSTVAPKSIRPPRLFLYKGFIKKSLVLRLTFTKLMLNTTLFALSNGVVGI